MVRNAQPQIRSKLSKDLFLSICKIILSPRAKTAILVYALDARMLNPLKHVQSTAWIEQQVSGSCWDNSWQSTLMSCENFGSWGSGLNGRSREQDWNQTKYEMWEHTLQQDCQQKYSRVLELRSWDPSSMQTTTCSNSWANHRYCWKSWKNDKMQYLQRHMSILIERELELEHQTRDMLDYELSR